MFCSVKLSLGDAALAALSGTEVPAPCRPWGWDFSPPKRDRVILWRNEKLWYALLRNVAIWNRSRDFSPVAG